MSRACLLGECVKEGWGTRGVRGGGEEVGRGEMSFKKENESGWMQKKKEKCEEGRSD